jgi:DNA-binding IclR family transcriptional regulator
VGQTLDVLELLARAERPLGLTEIADRLELSAPATHRLLTTLLDRGYVAQEPFGSKYIRGLACFSLAALAASRRTLHDAATGPMRNLNLQTGEAVHLVVYESGSAVYIDKLESLRETAPVSRVGERAPVHCVATGRAILAYLPLADLDALLAGGLQRFTATTLADRAELLADLAQTRRRGYAINRGSWRAAVGGVAAPIREFSGIVQASVGCCLPLERFTKETIPELAAHTVQTATAISRHLGFVSPEGEG